MWCTAERRVGVCRGRANQGPHAFTNSPQRLESGPQDETGALKFTNELTAEYVYAFPLWFGPIGFLNTCHPEYAKTILATTEPKDEVVYRFIKPWIGDGLLVSHGQKWFRNRRLLTPAFHFGVLQPYTRIFSDSTNIMMAKWKQQGAGALISVFDDVSLMTLDSMLKCALTVDSNCQVDRKQNPYVSAVFGLGKLAVQRFLFFPLHSDLIYYFTPMGYRFRKLCHLVHQHSETIIRERRQALKHQEGHQDSGQGKKYLDFLDILLKTKDEDGNGLSDAEIRDEVDTFMFEGHDTTASGLSWTLYNLARHPEYQERCRQEARSVLEGRSEVTGPDLPKLSYITMCIKESLRLHTTVPGVGRKLTKEITFPDGKTLPAGSNVGVSPWNIHHNPHVWKDPKASGGTFRMPSPRASQHLRELQHEYDSGLCAVPENLVPGIPDSRCPNNFAWDSSDPIENGWCYTETVTVYTEQCSFQHTNADGELKAIKVFYRVCTGECNCVLPYDGQEDLLFNLNNKDLIAYSMLFRYLHLMLEARNPLAAFHRAYRRQIKRVSRTIFAGSALHVLTGAQYGLGKVVYDPSRFLPENSKGRHSHAFLPFSAGPRNCIGQHFAMNELKTAVALIVQSFQLTVDENHIPTAANSLVLKAAEPGLFLKVTALD
ncbi:hypothetical protein Bbelb_125680 [Branchiostoma belcheri]|nr:hypothetical protein Bbelb_125680 [Branchiostoma belcheri]